MVQLKFEDGGTELTEHDRIIIKESIPNIKTFDDLKIMLDKLEDSIMLYTSGNDKSSIFIGHPHDY